MVQGGTPPSSAGMKIKATSPPYRLSGPPDSAVGLGKDQLKAGSRWLANLQLCLLQCLVVPLNNHLLSL